MIFGKYELIDRIAVGDTSEVFCARYAGTQGFVKLLAIKRVGARHSQDVGFARAFTNEVKLMARLDHENIVQIHDFDQADGHYYVAMELVRGKDLRRMTEALEHAAEGPRARLTISQSIYVATECLAGLMAAHERQSSRGRPGAVVHGSLCPRNILVSFAGEIKLASFGVAKTLLPETDGPSVETGHQRRYRPPEQRPGGPADPRGDIYSVGGILWELVTDSRLPDPPSGSALREAQALTEVPDPSVLNCEISPRLREVILTMLRPDPADRYATAREALGALRSLTDARDQSLEMGALMEWCFPKESASSRRSSISHKGTPTEPPKTDARSPRSVAPPSEPDRIPRISNPRNTPGRDRNFRFALLLVAILVTTGGVGYLLWERLARPSISTKPSGRQAAPASPSHPKAGGAAALDIRSAPPGAEITIDRIPTGRHTPAILGIPAGAHVVQLRWPDGARAAWSGSCAPGARRRISLRAPPRSMWPMERRRSVQK